MNALARLIGLFHDCCTEVGLDYLYVGAVAVMTWGDPRATRDVDIILRPERERLLRLASLLQARELSLDPRDFDSALQDRGHISVYDPASLYHLDIKLARGVELQEMDDSERVEFHGRKIHVASPEDTIAFKLAFGSEQDLKDARSIVWRLGDRIDEDRLTRAAARARVADRLEAFFDEAKMIQQRAEAEGADTR